MNRYVPINFNNIIYIETEPMHFFYIINTNTTTIPT